jgi:hypothetical protein
VQHDLNHLRTEGFLLLRNFLPEALLRELQLYCTRLIDQGGLPKAGLRNLLGSDVKVTSFANSNEVTCSTKAKEPTGPCRGIRT